ncbi:homoserine dehydrogenase [Geomicrobium sp. JCM 19037]|uniref:homoserine dehydrogenase n=1 Tax=unclassified Geomicrobium TaxID=2628951 RepID=UPI00045F204B|nr:homoserine dehydrogenase [Geomicrobium sp. JCM 19037]GAK06230.1 homoserine dehydrogenase [Geomicrobium sp. JCM 19037]
MNIYLSGFGRIGRQWIELLDQKRELLNVHYGLRVKIVGLIGRNGALVCEEGFDMRTVLRYETLEQLAKGENLEWTKEWHVHGDVLVDSTPTYESHGEPGYTYIKKALQMGMHVVSISKGALLHHYDELMGSAAEKGLKIKYSGATAAALPALDIGEHSIVGAELLGFEGVLNGTSNYVLTEMQERGISYEQAIAAAKEQGVAEPDPTLDVSGADSAAKVVLLSNALLGTKARKQDVDLEGIEQFPGSSDKDRVVRLVASAYKREDNTVQLAVKPKALSPDHPLAAIRGTNKAITFHTVEMGVITVSGGASSPLGAASAALKDLINLNRC